jgi:putative MATE family efflux protein
MRFDREYFKSLFTIALPIIVQNLILSSLNMIDVLIVGQLGEVSVASVGLANQVTFLMFFLIFGVTSGSAMFAAQFWGKRDVVSVRKVLGISLSMAGVGSLIFVILALGFPRAALSFYTTDPAVIAEGSGYLRIIGFCYPFLAITFSNASILRSTGNVRLPMIVGIVALGLKTLMTYTFVFGLFGFPVMGIQGAALATVIARILECGLLITGVYKLHMPTAAKLKEIFSFTRAFLFKVLKTSLPVVINEMLWSIGISTYNAIYAHIGTEAIAAMNISGTIENLAFVTFIGISDACGILIGNNIGAGHPQRAFDYARRTLLLSTLGAILMGGVIFLFSGRILALYKVAPVVMDYARTVLTVVSCCLWIRVNNMTIVVGILRAGGDTRFSMWLDAGTVWLVGIPLALLGAFVFKLPVYWVYLMVMAEEFTKYLVGLWRVLTRKWMNDLTDMAAV